MRNEPQQVAYKITWNWFEGRGDDIIGRLIPFEGSREIISWSRTDEIKVPNPIYFAANFGMLDLAPDYPNNDDDWPIMSRRMLDALLGVRPFAHRAMPVMLLDDTVMENYDETGQPRPRVAKDGYFVVQLLEHVDDVIDWERSDWEPLEEGIDYPGQGRMWKLAIKPPPEGLPPLFRVAAMPEPLLISAEGRAALEHAGVHPEYDSLQRVGGWCDVPDDILARAKQAAGG